jgi:hypothetical protein
MSIIRMADQAALRQRERETVKALESSSGLRDSNVNGALDKIAAYIPSEVIGTYVAISGIVAPKSADTKWIIFGLALLLIPMLTLLGNALAKKRGLPAPGGRATLIIILLAAIAFCAWAAALPDNPLVACWADATRYGGGAVIVLAVLLPRVAELFDIAPQN